MQRARSRSPRSRSPTQQTVTDLRDFLTRYNIKGRYVCFTPDPTLKKATGYVVKCLPSEKILKYLKVLKAQVELLGTSIPKVRAAELRRSYDNFERYVVSLIMNSEKLQDEVVSVLTGEQFYSAMIDTIPLAHDLYARLKTIPSSRPVINQLLYCEGIKPGFEVVQAQWYLPVILNAVSAVSGGQYPVLSRKITPTILQQIQDFYVECALPK